MEAIYQEDNVCHVTATVELALEAQQLVQVAKVGGL